LNVEEYAAQFVTAWGIVFPGESLPSASQLEESMERMADAVIQAFGTVMPMRFPRTPGARPVHEPHDGLGWVARIVGRFVGMGWQTDDVLDLPMDQMFIFSAALQGNEGAECAGSDYREREVAGRKAETADRNGLAAGGEAAAVDPTKNPENKSGEEQGSGNCDCETPSESALNVSVEPVPDTGHGEVPSGRGEEVHTGRVA
jgi:hypothetical protein